MSSKTTAKLLISSLAVTTSLACLSAPPAYSLRATETQGDVQKVFKEPQINQLKLGKVTPHAGVEMLPSGFPTRLQYSPLWSVTPQQRSLLGVFFCFLLVAMLAWFFSGLRLLVVRHVWDRI